MDSPSNETVLKSGKCLDEHGKISVIMKGRMARMKKRVGEKSEEVRRGKIDGTSIFMFPGGVRGSNGVGANQSKISDKRQRQRILISLDVILMRTTFITHDKGDIFRSLDVILTCTAFITRDLIKSCLDLEKDILGNGQ